tara:strand:- start:1282 stop:2166 length:885 start_codon:yes stop_codon:yes gene_type:complete
MTLSKALADCAIKINKTMEDLLPEAMGAEATLLDAMKYSSLGEGKKIRPFMVLQSSKLFGVKEESARRVGSAVEFLHSYSLIHDDLPAMDDSDFRRGKKSCHKYFNEATAILAGDALLTLAFEILSDPLTAEDSSVRCQLVNFLAKSAGHQGMVAGQTIDLLAEGKTLCLDEIVQMQSLKTGEIFAFCMVSGGILGSASKLQLDALRKYAYGFGIAFQIVDDLLDVEGNIDTIGKPGGQDAKMEKATLVAKLGVEEARHKAVLLVDESIEALKLWGREADCLRALAQFVLERQR